MIEEAKEKPVKSHSSRNIEGRYMTGEQGDQQVDSCGDSSSQLPQNSWKWQFGNNLKQFIVALNTIKKIKWQHCVNISLHHYKHCSTG